MAPGAILVCWEGEALADRVRVSQAGVSLERVCWAPEGRGGPERVWHQVVSGCSQVAAMVVAMVVAYQE